MNKPLKIIVVIATFNGVRHIIDQLDSIRSQSIHVDTVYIADDGSTDGTVEIVKKWILDNHLDGHWKIEINAKRLGYADNFMNLIAKATERECDYLFLADQDDVWYYDKVEKMISFAEQHLTIELLCSDLEVFYMDKNAMPYHLAKLKYSKKPVLRFCSQWLWSLRPGCSFMLKRSFAIEAVRLWRQTEASHAKIAHDLFMWALGFLKDVVGLYPYNTMKYRRHNYNNSNVFNLRSQNPRINLLKQQISLIDIFERTLIEVPEKKKSFISNQRSFYVRRLLYLSQGRKTLIYILVDGILHINKYVRIRHYISDLYVCMFSSAL